MSPGVLVSWPVIPALESVDPLLANLQVSNSLPHCYLSFCDLEVKLYHVNDADDI
jgi:hypothetical protein